MFKFFISYRRQDSRDIAARLDDRLVRHFGRESVFFDIDAIPPGVEFPKRLADELNRCDVLLAVIGDHWLDAAFDEEGPKKGQRRLEDPRDYVRIEIERALERGIRVVPLLVGQTHTMPAAPHLPDGLKALADWQAHVIQFGPDFHDQVDRLIRGLESEQFEAKKEKLQQDVQKAIDIANQAPKMALSGGRDVLELVMQDVYRRRFSEPPGHRSLEVLTERLTEEGHLPDQLGFGAMLRTFSGAGTARWSERITGESVRRSLTQLKKILDWYIEIEQPGAPGWRPAADGEPASRRIKPGDTLPPTRREGRIAVVPKGLDSFDANDSRFFLQLLPGPRDEDGLPESIRFWKHKIEATNEPTFTVGVIFGPSGCGKTSLVKAGLLPRLAEHVVPVYVEATAEETEVRLLAGLRKQCPNLPGDLDLTGTIAALRQGQGLDHSQRVLIVLDQFEQWLHAKREEANTELAQALRQCDGERVKAIIMVRADGDFWMEVTRFLRELHIEVQGQNSAAVALFEPRHAKKVLIAFGQAFGALDEKLSKDQESFVDKAIQGLAENGRIMPVRLALFADMVKDKPWTQSTFKDVGGAEGIGVLFLEEKFNSTTLKPHRRAAQALLKALLPEEGTEIKGQKRSVHQLLDISGYRSRPADFHDLLRVLNNECRLITPATYDADSPDLKEGDGDGLPVAARFYQLTHDYLVPSLREWLDREQQKTRRGRAEKLLASRASMWKHERADRFLPSLREHLDIRILTNKRDWSDLQKFMMARSRRVHLRRSGALLVVLVILGGVALWVRALQLEEGAKQSVESLRTAHIAQVPRTIDHLNRYGLRSVRLLQRVCLDSDRELKKVKRDLEQISASQEKGGNAVAEEATQRKSEQLKEEKSRLERERLNVALALLPDPAQLDYLRGQLLIYDPDTFPTLQRLLSPYRAALEGPLWHVLESEPGKSDGKDEKLQAACFLAEAATRDADAAAKWKKSAKLVADQIVEKLVQDPSHFKAVVESFRPASGQLREPLLTIYRNRDPAIGAQRALARSILVTYFLKNFDVMTTVLADDDVPKSYNATFDKLPNAGRPLVEPMIDQLSQPLSPRANGANAAQDTPKVVKKKTLDPKAMERQLEDHARHAANAAVTLIRLGQPTDKVWDLLRRAPDPRTRSYIIDRLGPFGVPHQAVIERALNEEEDVSIREALLLALGEFSLEKLTETERSRLCDKLTEVYHRHRDPGLHGASRWLLAKLAQGDRVTRIDGELAGIKPPAGQRWYVNGQHQTMVVIPGPVEFEIGSPFNEPFREVGSDSGVERQHRVRIERGYAIAAHEVTVEDFMARFSPMHNVDTKRLALGPDGKVDPRCPINNISWYQAAAYCNWLSKRDGIPENQWCYKPNKGGQYASGMKPTDNYLSLTGYRLPTEAEWEYACRAGTTTMRYYGQADELLEKYAWFEVNSMNPENSAQQLQPAGRLKPNDLGLFDTLGNALEWCQDEYKKPKPTAGKSDPLVVDNPDASEVNDAQFRIARGEKFLGKRESIRAARRDHKHSPKAQDFIMGLRPARTHPANP